MKHEAASGMVSEHLQRATFGSGTVWPLNIEYTVVSMSEKFLLADVGRRNPFFFFFKSKF